MTLFSLGTNWYNSEYIYSAPGDSHVGWSGLSDGWVDASHPLTNLAGKGNVLLRIAFASDFFRTSEFDGFAFDDVYIR
jgi:hypothetical protein